MGSRDTDIQLNALAGVSEWISRRLSGWPLLALGIALVIGVAAADYAGGPNQTFIGLVLLGPFVVSLGARPWETAIVAALAVAALLASLTWSSMGGWGLWLRLVFVPAGGFVAWAAASARQSELRLRRLAEERAIVASILEAGLAPAPLPAIEGWRVSALYRPAEGPASVGGDFYDVCQTPDGWALVIGDVVGHGPAAAATTALVRYTLRTAATTTAHIADALELLSRELSKQRPGLSCACVLAVLPRHAGGGAIEVLCAGGHRPYLIRAGGAHEVGELGTLVGAIPDVSWSGTPVLIHERETLVLFTDGVLDLRGAAESFGPRRLERALADARDPDDVVARVRAALDDFGGRQQDDIVLVALQRTPVAADRGWPARAAHPDAEPLAGAASRVAGGEQL